MPSEKRQAQYTVVVGHIAKFSFIDNSHVSYSDISEVLTPLCDIIITNNNVTVTCCLLLLSLFAFFVF